MSDPFIVKMTAGRGSGIFHSGLRTMIPLNMAAITWSSEFFVGWFTFRGFPQTSLINHFTKSSSCQNPNSQLLSHMKTIF